MDVRRHRTESVSNPSARRSFIASALALGAAVLPSRVVSAGNAGRSISWVHGSSAMLAGARQLESDVIQGNARVVRGRSWSSIPLHFSVPSPGLESGRRMRIAAVWLRFQSGGGAWVESVMLHDCEVTVARIDGLALRQPEWGDVRVPFDKPCAVARCIGVTLGCKFEETGRQVCVSAVGCEFA